MTVRGALYPGVPRPLLVDVHNRASRAVVLHSMRVEVVRASEGCPPRALRLDAFTGTLPIAARGHRVVALTARMSARARNACQGATFRLRASAYGQAAKR